MAAWWNVDVKKIEIKFLMELLCLNSKTGFGNVSS